MRSGLSTGKKAWYEGCVHADLFVEKGIIRWIRNDLLSRVKMEDELVFVTFDRHPGSPVNPRDLLGTRTSHQEVPKMGPCGTDATRAWWDVGTRYQDNPRCRFEVPPKAGAWVLMKGEDNAVTGEYRDCFSIVVLVEGQPCSVHPSTDEQGEEEQDDDAMHPGFHLKFIHS